jgi:hypothetical protein
VYFVKCILIYFRSVASGDQWCMHKCVLMTIFDNGYTRCEWWVIPRSHRIAKWCTFFWPSTYPTCEIKTSTITSQAQHKCGDRVNHAVVAGALNWCIRRSTKHSSGHDCKGLLDAGSLQMVIREIDPLSVFGLSTLLTFS